MRNETCEWNGASWATWNVRTTNVTPPRLLSCWHSCVEDDSHKRLFQLRQRRGG
ncbi:hypothetical protein LCGC14_0322950 [marine sediment metagenome]|uniref:Uncharacterized protein n=1 Tax=marine sediment metagenome TaxID=412755 RepID=A0A0F9W5W8_9ZZZZ